MRLKKDIESSKVGERKDVLEHLTNLFRRSKKGVDAKNHPRIAKLLVSFQDVFSKGDMDIGGTSLVRHKIETGDA